MIIFDLICAQHHIFEGWFASSHDYENQKEKKLLICPTCGSADIKKSVMAPNIGLKGNQKKITPARHHEIHPSVKLPKDRNLKSDNPKLDEANISVANENTAAIQEAAKALAKMQEAALKESDWVGGKFSQEARSMHYGEADKRQIHGHATQKEASELQEEGIEIAALPLPYIPPDMKN